MGISHVQRGLFPCLAARDALVGVELKSRHAELDGGHGLDTAGQGLVIDALLPERREGEHIDTQRDGGGKAEGSLTDTSCSRAHCRKSPHLRTSLIRLSAHGGSLFPFSPLPAL